jgi:flagellar basal-body rod protein FlgB
MDILGTGAMRAARTALDGLARRHEAISSNIANIDTPGYQRRTAAGGLHLESTDARHLQPGMHGNVSVLGGGGPSREAVSERNDANSVSIDEEMTNLAETQIRFQALSQTVGQRISTLRAVIRGQ